MPRKRAPTPPPLEWNESVSGIMLPAEEENRSLLLPGEEVVEEMTGEQALSQLIVPDFPIYVPDSIYDSPKQVAFAALPHLEAFFGGTAGSGKTESLLACALQYVEHPNYNAMVLRKHITDSRRASSILDRCLEWLDPWIRTKEVTFDSEMTTFTFPSGANVAFGFMSAGFSESFQGGTIQCVCIDELPQHLESDYRWWLTRLRRLKTQGAIPIRLRAAGNPGGRGNKWVRKRFRITNIAPAGEEKKWVGQHPTRVFFPASFRDNPAIDAVRYEETMRELGDTAYRQMVLGDWDAEDESRYDSRCFKTRWTRGDDRPPVFHLEEGETGRIESLPLHEAWNIITTLDVAASVKTGVGGVSFYEPTSRRPAEPCWTVASTWAIFGRYILLVDHTRVQQEAPQTRDLCKQILSRWRRTSFLIEENGVGKPILSFLQEAGLPAVGKSVSSDKITRSIRSQQLAAQGRIVLPKHAPWLSDWEEEVFGWTGHPHEADDQVDALSLLGYSMDALSLFEDDEYAGNSRPIVAGSPFLSYREAPILSPIASQQPLVFNRPNEASVVGRWANTPTIEESAAMALRTPLPFPGGST